MLPILLLAAVAALPVDGPITSFGPAVVSHYTTFDPSSFQESTDDLDSVVLDLMDSYGFISCVSDNHCSDVRITTSYQSHGTSHHYLTQTFNSLDIVNAVANVNLDSKGRLLSMGNSFYATVTPILSFQSQDSFRISTVATDPVLSPLDALNSLLTLLKINEVDANVLDLGSYYSLIHPISDSEIPVKLAYLTNANSDSLNLVWDIQIDLVDDWYHAHIDALTGQVLSLVNWVSHSSFNVFPVGQNDPISGTRQIVMNPEIRIASPLGWNTRVYKSKTVMYNETKGNNVYAQNNPDGGNEYEGKLNHRPKAENGLVFNSPINYTLDPTSYVDAAITNLFYWNNIMHDLFYLYGFTEIAGNFQDENFKRGGKGNDAVVAFAQDGSGTNNANFATPPDGTFH